MQYLLILLLIVLVLGICAALLGAWLGDLLGNRLMLPEKGSALPPGNVLAGGQG
jgi:hypothetical protein